MFKCSANCCNDSSLKQTEFQQCLDTCSTPAIRADKHLRDEMQDMQDQFETCAQTCLEKVKSQGAVSNQKNKAAMRVCVDDCAQHMLKIIENTFKFFLKKKEFCNYIDTNGK